MNVTRLILNRYQAARDTTFLWGEQGLNNDCLHWAALVAQDITGQDPIADIRGYTTEGAAKRIMVERGWKSIGDVAANYYQEIPPALARTGDWATVRNEDGTDLVGVVVGSVVAARTPTGMGQVPRSRAERAFRVEAR